MKNFLLFVALFVSVQLFAQNATLYGVVKETDGEPLEGVILQSVNTGERAVTNQFGEYELELPVEQDLTIRTSYIGYLPMIYAVRLEGGKTKRLNIELSIDEQQIEGVQITEQGQREKASVYKIDSEQLKQLPAVAGGVEALIKTLPGVRSNNELSSQFSVRGGSYDENVVYINDFEIVRPQLIRSGQQEGLSVINSQMVDEIYFSAGGFEPQFGDKLSSVLSIQYIEPETFKGNAYAGFMGAGVAVENTSKNKDLYYKVGGRFHSNKYLLNSLEEKGEYNPVSYDGQVMLGTNLTNHSKLEFLGYANKTKYDFIPNVLNANFGTFDNVLTFQANIDGEENDDFQTLFGGLKYENDINERLKIGFNAGMQANDEKEAIDFTSSYLLGNQNFQDAKVDTLAQGTQIDFVNNELQSNRYFVGHKGLYSTANEKHYVTWGVNANIFNFEDALNEKDELIREDRATGTIDTIYENQIENSFDLDNTIIDAYLQDTYVPVKLDQLSLTGGTRLSYATFTEELLVSPRLQASYRPNASNSVFRFAMGLYQQHPMYREFRNIKGEINEDLKAQKSVHGIIGLDHKFSSKQNLPFTFTAEAYYKSYWDVIPYEYDVIRIRYLGDNLATAYVAGIDARLYGEFVKNAPSWISVSLLKTEEDIEGQGKVRRPTDQRLNMSVFWQDYFSTNENFKVNMVGEFGGKLPIGQADGNRLNDDFDIPSYKRLDVGFSANLKGKKASRLPNSPFENVRSVWLTGELFNMFNIQNTSSYQWVTTPQDATYAVPNRLTSRRLNAKLTIEF